MIEVLGVVDPEHFGVRKVIIWGGSETLSLLDHKKWLERVELPDLWEGALSRAGWQRFGLPRAARAVGCDLLFVPGGSYGGGFRPVVTMCRNMLPFEWKEIMRYGFSQNTIKLLLRRVVQSQSFRNADGVIFLSDYARQRIGQVVGPLRGRAITIPHGLNERFFVAPRIQSPIADYSTERPFRLLYVSTINEYKHQPNVVESVARLRAELRWPLALDLVGPSYTPTLKRLKACMRKWDPERSWVTYHGKLPYANLDQIYRQADLGVFASSCENMPNGLLESMAAGLPIACSNRGPMPEIVKNGAVWFDPEKPEDIAQRLREVIGSPDLRTEISSASHSAAERYSWERCAADTFRFLGEIVGLSGTEARLP